MAHAARRLRLPARVREALAPRPDHYEILDTALAQRMGGLLWFVGGLVALALLPLAPPDHAIGDAGWAIAGVMVAASLGCGAALLPGRVAPPREMLAMSLGAPVMVALLGWLAGPSSPYCLLLVLSTLWSASAHPPRWGVALAVLAAAVALAPLAYGPWDEDVVARHLAVVAMLWALASCCLLWNERLRDARRELHRQREAAIALSMVDPLTGLGNRRALDEALRIAVAVVDRTGRALSVLAGDLDGFKAINDRHGHQAGDHALQCVSTVLRDVVRRPDVCFRWGGDEFVVLLPDASLAEAQLVAERLRTQIAERCSDPSGAPVVATFGAAEHAPWMRGDELLAAADAVLLERRTADRAAR